MSITENSLFVRFFLSLWLCLKNAAANSALGRACDRLEGWFLRQAENSAICTFVWREGRIPRAWPHSIACRLFTAIINIPCALFKAVYRAGKRVWDASLFCRLIGALGGASFLFLGLFMMVMLMTPHAMWNNVYGLMGAVALTGLFVVGSASRPKHRLELDTLGPYMTLYMAFICIALAGSLSTRLSLRFFAFHLTGFLLVLLVVSMVRKYEQLQLMVALAVLGLSVAALYGCYQSYIGVDIVASQQDMNLNQGMPGRVYSFFDNPNNFAEQLAMLLPLNLALFLNSRWRGKLLSLLSLGVGLVAIGATYGRASWIGLAGAVLVFLALLNWRWVPVFLPGRVYSFFDNPNNFAEQLAMLLPLNLALFLNSRWRGKLLSLLSLGVGLVAIGATYGRASWIGLAGAVLVFLALLNWRWVPVFLLVGLAAIPFLPETIYNRILTIFNAGEDSSVQYRFGIYETTRNLMEDYWARGVGLGTDVMKKVFQTYPTNFDGSYPVHTHNNYLQMWGETGILGLLAYLSLLLYQLKSGVKSFCAALDPRVKRMMAAAIGAFCGILVIGVAEYTWYYPRNMFTYWFLFGVIGACIKLVRMEQDKQAA